MTVVIPNGLLGGIPVEILQLILTDDAFSRRDWRFCTRPVCRLWLDLVGGKGKEAGTSGRLHQSHSLDKRLPHQRFRHGWGVPDELHSQGLYVRAATMVEWAHMRPDLWDHQPDTFYRLCRDHTHSNVADAAIVLMATGRAPMTEYVLNQIYPMVVDMMAKGQRDAVNGKTDPDCCPSSQYASIEQIQDCLVDAAGVWGDLGLVEHVMALIGPTFVVHERVRIDWFLHSADIGEYVMRAGVGFPHAEHLHGATDGPCSNTDGDNSASTRVDKHDRKTLRRLASSGAIDLFERLTVIASRAGENPQDMFAQRVARALAQNGMDLANHAVEPNSMGVLRLLEPTMDGATVGVVMERACRSLVPSVLEWIVGVAKARSHAIDLFRLAKLAVRAFFSRHDKRPSPHTESILEWLCDPAKGGYQPTRVDWEALMETAMREKKGDSGCALWLAERWPERLQRGCTLGSGASPLLDRLVRHTCAVSTRYKPFSGTTTGAMDRLVLLLDLCVERGVLAPGSVDLWSILIEIIGSTDGQKCLSAVRMLKYACLRCTGILPHPDHDYGDPECPRTVCGPDETDGTPPSNKVPVESALLPEQGQCLSGTPTDCQVQGGDVGGVQQDGDDTVGSESEDDDQDCFYDSYSTVRRKGGITYLYAFAPIEWESFDRDYDCDHMEKLSRTWDAPVPASHMSWRRWCRARPLALADLVRDVAHIEDPSKNLYCVYYGFLVRWVQETLNSQVQ